MQASDITTDSRIWQRWTIPSCPIPHVRFLFHGWCHVTSRSGFKGPTSYRSLLAAPHHLTQQPQQKCMKSNNKYQPISNLAYMINLRWSQQNTHGVHLFALQLRTWATPGPGGRQKIFGDIPLFRSRRMVIFRVWKNKNLKWFQELRPPKA